MINHPNNGLIDELFDVRKSGRFFSYAELSSLLDTTEGELKEVLGSEFFTKGGLYGSHNSMRGGYTIYGRLKTK